MERTPDGGNQGNRSVLNNMQIELMHISAGMLKTKQEQYETIATQLKKAPKMSPKNSLY